VKNRANKAIAWITAAGASATSMAFAFPTLAFAEAKSGVAAILPDPVEFVPMLIAFLILVWVLAKKGWPLYEGMLKKREDTIRTALEESEKARVESERVLEEYKKQLADAKAQSAQIVANARETGEATRASITKQAQDESTAMIERAREAIEAEKKAAIDELQGSIADISVEVASRLIGEDLTDAEHRKLIERYVNEAGSFHVN
jgi:F-type H+-transporting ATPase subunit b